MAANTLATAQEYIGVFENNADQQVYVIQSNIDQPASLVRVDNFMNPSDVPDVKTAIGAVYSQQYQRLFAVYENKEGVVIAHALDLSENQTLEVQARFGAAFEPNYNSYFGVVLTRSNQLIAFRATY